MRNLFRALAFLCVLSGFAGTAGAQSATTTPVCPLLGQYAFLFSGNFGTAATGRAGEFSVNSHGSVTGGTEDIYDVTSANLPITSGRCTSGANGLDTLTLTAGGITTTYKFVVTKTGNARMVEFDSNCPLKNCVYGITYGSGIIRKQDKTAFSLARLAGDWAFRFSGTDGGTLAEIGRLTVTPDGSTASLGNSVVQVFDGHTPTPGLQSLVAPSAITSLNGGTGRGTATETLSIYGIPLTFNFAFYVVSANELWFLETDSPQHIYYLLGEQVRQVGAGHFGVASLNSGSVFSLTGFNGQGIEIFVGQMAADGKGNLSGEMDWNNDGIMSFALPLSGTYTISPDGFGSATLSNGAWWLVMISPNTAYLLTQDDSVSTGQLEPQSKVLSVQGSYASGTVPIPISNFFGTGGFQGVTSLVGIATFSAGTLNETLDTDTNATLQSNVPVSGIYTLTGGRVVLPAADGGSPSTGYVISPTRFVTISSTNTDATLVRFEQ